jgi:hypothetical protein
VSDLGKLAEAAQTARPAPAIDNAKPWEGARVVIKVKNGKSVVVDAKTVQRIGVIAEVRG